MAKFTVYRTKVYVAEVEAPSVREAREQAETLPRKGWRPCSDVVTEIVGLDRAVQRTAAWKDR